MRVEASSGWRLRGLRTIDELAQVLCLRLLPLRPAVEGLADALQLIFLRLKQAPEYLFLVAPTWRYPPPRTDGAAQQLANRSIVAVV